MCLQKEKKKQSLHSVTEAYFSLCLISYVGQPGLLALTVSSQPGQWIGGQPEGDIITA